MRHSTIILFSLTAAALALALQAGSQGAIEKTPISWRQANLAGGEELYAELCAACHGVTAQGDGPAASALLTQVPDLTRLAQRNGGVFPAKQVQKKIAGEAETRDASEMPRWGEAFESLRPDWKPARREAFARTQVGRLTEHLESIQVL